MLNLREKKKCTKHLHFGDLRQVGGYPNFSRCSPVREDGAVPHQNIKNNQIIDSINPLVHHSLLCLFYFLFLTALHNLLH